MTRPMFLSSYLGFKIKCFLLDFLFIHKQLIFSQFLTLFEPALFDTNKCFLHLF